MKYECIKTYSMPFDFRGELLDAVRRDNAERNGIYDPPPICVRGEARRPLHRRGQEN
jgi:hypothetical protein